MNIVLNETKANADHFQQIKNFLNLVDCWSVRISTRKQLGKLSVEQLADIGISEYDRQQEISKPFWR